MDNAKTLKRVLVANRGEIACRVMRTVQGLGRQAVAIYSDADLRAPHVAMSDAAYRVGPAPVGESYLNIEAIIAAARAAEADAIHPGYGFLAENAAFARAVTDAGLTFIGPSADAIDLMGNKAAAKRRMIEAGVPCVPGYQEADQSDAAFISAAEKIGFPVMVKAAAGGGGRGMRRVETAADLPGALEMARAEAQHAFGSGELILEKAVVRPRHVEIQVFADRHGHVIHLGERDCSVQRRHQKVVEEAPCPVMTPELRVAMGTAAVEAARSIDYIGAGTVEFLLDASGAFYFLEMNTRLQVEHPVTEMITGLDLVEVQLMVAEGRPLPLAQDDLRLNGHAIEVRLYAEDPKAGFLPSTGLVERFVPPTGDGVRVDAGIVSGSEISPYYDPMAAKIVAWGPNRETARLRLVAALERTAFFGVKNNRDFLIKVLERPVFARGEATTAFIETEFDEASLGTDVSMDDAAVAAVLQYEEQADEALDASVGVARRLLRWSSASPLSTLYRYEVAGTPTTFMVSPGADGYVVSADDRRWTIKVIERASEKARLEIDRRRVVVMYALTEPARIYQSVAGRAIELDDLKVLVASTAAAGGDGQVAAPMHGLLVEVAVTEGQPIKRGDRVVILEAMKMQHEILAEVDGTVAAVHATSGQQVAAETVLVEITPSAEAETPS